MQANFFKTGAKILFVLLPLAALGLTGCASNPDQPSYAAPAYYGGVYYGAPYSALGENPYGYGYNYWYGYGYPWYPGVWDYSPPLVIENNPPGTTPSPPPHPVQPPPIPPGPHRPFIKPAPPRRAHSGIQISPP
jgi:hypothetical protein